MPSKEFTSKQKEIVARKLGYDGPMHMFDEFLKSDPSLADRYGTVLDKYMARGGVVSKKKKYAEGGVTRLKTEAELEQEALNQQTSAIINPASAVINPGVTQTSAVINPGVINPGVTGPTITPVDGADIKLTADQLADVTKNTKATVVPSTPVIQDNTSTTIPVDTVQGPTVITDVSNIKPAADDAGVDEITALYREVLGRDPDAGGLDYWDKTGLGPAQIRQYLLGSSEYANRQAKGASVGSDTITGSPTIGGAAGVTAARITPTEDQIIQAREGITASQATTSTVPGAAQAASVTATKPETVEATKTYDSVTDVTDTLTGAVGAVSDTITAAEGTVSSGAIAAPATFDETFQSKVTATSRTVDPTEIVSAAESYIAPVVDVKEADVPKQVEAVTREVQDNEIAKAATLAEANIAQGKTQEAAGLTTDAKIVAAKLDKFTLDAGTLADFVEGTVEAKATVQGQLTDLMKSFDDGKTPAWAAGAIRAANAAMAARGLGNSSMASAAIFQAAMESALPIAQQDAQTYAQMGLQNLNNRQQVALANAAAQQGVEIANFNAEQQAALQNAVNSFSLQSQNLSNVQQTMLANLQVRAAVQQIELSNQQQAMLTNAARYAEIANINLNNQQQAALQSSAQNVQVDLANLSTRQQSALANAQIEAAMKGKVLDNQQQAAVLNAARYAEANNMTFTAEQNAMLHNSELMKTIGLANLSSEQASVLQNAATYAAMDMANLNNRQQAAVVNAQAFLQMDLANLSNEQQTSLFKSQQVIQSLFTDAAAENAAEQFNATSQMQTDQFFASIKAQVDQFNTAQSNAMSQFNSGQTNSMSQFNVSQMNAMEQFNAQQRLVIDQSNAEWRRNIATADTAAINQANQFNAQMGMQLSLAQYNNMWQGYRDSMQYAHTSSQNDLDRENRLAIAQLQKDAAIEAAKASRTAAAVSALGGLTATMLGKTTLGQTAVDAVTNVIKSFTGTADISSTELANLSNQAMTDMFGEIAASTGNVSGDYSGYYDELYTPPTGG
jgi:hypothetical protein